MNKKDKEQWQIEFTRKVCREHKLRYKIKDEALYLFVSPFGHYMRSCLSLLDYDSKEDILDMVEREIYTWQI